MKKFILAAAMVLAAVSTANAGVLSPDNVNTNTNANQNTQGQLQGQGQAQGQFQGQILNNANEAWSVSKSTSVAASNASSKASADNTNVVKNDVVVQGDSINYEAVASSAATLLSASCVNSVSMQGKEIGAAFSSDSPQCTNLRQADAEYARAKLLTGEARDKALKKAFEYVDKSGLYVDRTSGFDTVVHLVTGVAKMVGSVALVGFLLP